MKPIPWLIALSLAANAVLAALWLTPRAPEDSALRAVAKHPVAISTAGPAEAPAGSAAPAGVRAEDGAAAATWKEIQSDDLKEFIRRLRAVNCPEETIQDLVLAEVNRRFAARQRALWPERFEDRPFWKTQSRDPAENKKYRDRWKQQRALQKEKSELLVELLGVDPERLRLLAQGLEDSRDWQTARLDFLPEAKREAVAGYLDDFNGKQQEFYERNRGLWDAQSRAEQRELEAERLRGLAQFLTPEEVREYELRETQLASQLSHELNGVAIDRGEYEAVFDIRKKYGDSIYNYSDIETQQGRDQVEENKKAMQAEITAALGTDKAKDYQRSQDYGFQELNRLAKHNDLPAGTAAKIYDYKDAAEASVKQLGENQSLTPAQRQAAVQEIRAETEKTLKATLGETVYRRYLYRGGWWLNELQAK